MSDGCLNCQKLQRTIAGFEAYRVEVEKNIQDLASDRLGLRNGTWEWEHIPYVEIELYKDDLVPFDGVVTVRQGFKVSYQLVGVTTTGKNSHATYELEFAS